jgi:hypothetical protein
VLCEHPAFLVRCSVEALAAAAVNHEEHKGHEGRKLRATDKTRIEHGEDSWLLDRMLRGLPALLSFIRVPSVANREQETGNQQLKTANW